MKVRTLKPHSNSCGAKVAKAKGDEYECSEKTGRQLISLGLVEEVGEQASAGGSGGAAKKEGK